jgi:hypothetical protein
VHVEQIGWGVARHGAEPGTHEALVQRALHDVASAGVERLA